MTDPYRGQNVQPESLTSEQAKLFLDELMGELHAACDLRCRQLLSLRGDLADNRLEPPTFVDRQAQDSVHMADAKQYLTEKLAEVRAQMQVCIGQLEAYRNDNRNDTFMSSFTPSPTALLAQARQQGAEAASEMTAEDIQKFHHRQNQVKDSVSYQEMWQVGNARRVVDPQWMLDKYTPVPLDMLVRRA